MTKLIILTCVGFLGMFSMVEAFTCDPVADCAAAGVVGAFVPDPNDCEKYYGCIEATDGNIVPTTSPISCPNGFYFEQLAKDCLVESTTGVCTNECKLQVCPTVCPFQPTTVSYISDRSDCSVFYACTQTGPVRGTCSNPTPYFNGETCVSNSTQCCDVCSAYCSYGGIQIEDPNDCTSYYICYGKGQPSESTRGTCEAGTHYKETTATCAFGPCNSYCNAAKFH